MSLKTVQSPAAAITALNTVAALIIAFCHLTPTEAGILTSLATAIGTVVTLAVQAAKGKPLSMSALAAAATVIFTDLAIFNIHLSSGEIAALVAGLGVVVGAVLQLLHVTAAAAVAPVPVPVPAPPAPAPSPLPPPLTPPPAV